MIFLQQEAAMSQEFALFSLTCKLWEILKSPEFNKLQMKLNTNRKMMTIGIRLILASGKEKTI